MATIYWTGRATAVAQIATAQVTGYDAATTYGLIVGSGNNTVTVSVPGTTSANGTATALAAAWNASTHPYCTGITASAATDTVTLTADTAGVPFSVTSSDTGGTGTIGAVSITTAATGPNHWDNAANWSGGAVPVDNDDVVIDSGPSICWGLAQSSVGLDSLTIPKSYSGRIGLNSRAFATTADGATTSTSVPEYRAAYLAIHADVVNVGENYSGVSQTGIGRLLLDVGSTAATITVHDTASGSADTGRPAVRLKAASASSNVYVRRAPGGVGIAADVAGETSTLASVRVTDESQTSRVLVGPGTTITTYEQRGGVNVLQAAATVTAVTVRGGVLATEGDAAVTTLAAYAGTTYSNSTGTITTLNIYGGTVDFRQNAAPRTITTLNNFGGTAIYPSTVVTLTNPPVGSLTVSA